MSRVIETHAIAAEIIQVLANYQVSGSLVDHIFDVTKEMIYSRTVQPPGDSGSTPTPQNLAKACCRPRAPLIA